ncbi:MAG TPA: SRPBCC domain-containing protein, partial [Fimbriimonadaceae bacterium]|nr:SRPBCC domain-containing protein [Fimbriimonadaceae bacterium]
MKVKLFSVFIAVFAAGASHAAERMIAKSVDVQAPVAEVWKAWTTPEGLKKFMGIESAIELNHGGKYEWYFSMEPPVGQRGSETCQVL